MQIKISSKHMDITPAIESYATKKVEKLSRFFDRIQQIDVVIDKAKKKDPSLATFLQQCMAASGARLDLESYLIKPVQRLPRYQLLLKELIKLTGSDHTDLPGLSEAVLRIAQRVGTRGRERIGIVCDAHDV